MEGNNPIAKNHTRHYSHRTNNHHEFLPSSSSILIIVIPIIIIVLILAILLLVMMLRRQQFTTGGANSIAGVAKNKSKVNNMNKNKNKNCMSIGHSTINMINSSPEVNGGCIYGTNIGQSNKVRGVQVFTLKETEMATDKFNEANLIGNGEYGMVCKGVLRDGTVVAIKKFHHEGRQGERAFRLQVDLLSRLQSPYIVELLGYCADQHHRLLVFEYMSKGCLQKNLHPRLDQCKNRNNKIRTTGMHWGIRLRIALDCARALEYLHEKANPSVIHRNFKYSNILLDQDYRAKLSGFGLAKVGSHKINGLVSTRVLGTTGYLAPEYASTGKPTTKSDVYSYGVILLQLLTGRVPIDTTRPPGEHVLVSWALPHLTNRDKVLEMIDPALENQYSKKDLIQVAAIAAMCVQGEAEYRPLMTDVVQSLIPLVKNQSHLTNSFRFNQTPSPN